MSINIGARRFAKAQRRKAAVAEKRKAELEAGSLAGQARLAAVQPIQHCLISGRLFDLGIGSLIFSRGPSPYDVTAAVFLCDTYALGVKDVFIRSLGEFGMEDAMHRLSLTSRLVPIEPGEARKLLRDLVTWSRGRGFAPHRDYARIEPIFGSVDAADCDVEFRFGFDEAPMSIDDISGGSQLLTHDDAAAD